MRAATKPFPAASIPLIPTSKARSGESAARFSMIAEITEASSIIICNPNRQSWPALICPRQSRGHRHGQRFTIRQRDGVHAVAQFCRRRSVVEDMSEMRATARAGNFRSEDRQKSAAFVYRFFADRLPETRPARAGVEFRLGAVERITARGANVNAFAVIKRVTARGRSLRARSTHDVELLRGHDELPFLVCEINFLIERNSVQLGANLRRIEIARTCARASGERSASNHT